MDENEKPRPVAPFELPSTLKYFAKDAPGWRFAVVVVNAAVLIALAVIYKLA